MAWIITYDHLDEVSCLFGEGDLKGHKRFRFRLYDGDGELYFSGMSTDRDSEVAFDPLDYCYDRYGCTQIHYQQDDESWQQL